MRSSTTSTSTALALALSFATGAHAFIGTSPVIAWGSEHNIQEKCEMDGGWRSGRATNPKWALKEMVPKKSINAAVKDGKGEWRKYVDVEKEAKGVEGGVEGLVRRCMGEEGEGAAVTMRTVQGLQEWQLVGGKARQGRREIVSRAESYVNNYLDSLNPSDKHLVVLTSLASSSYKNIAGALLSSSTPSHKCADQHDRELVKRAEVDVNAYDEGLDAVVSDAEVDEFTSTDDTGVKEVPSQLDEEYAASAPSEDEYTTTTTSSTASSEAAEELYEFMETQYEDFESSFNASMAAPKKNATNIFKKDGGGLMYRYIFFTPALIFGLLISLLLLIPVLVFTSQALTSTQTVAGLEGKMVGTVGLDPAKA
ncbi:hypothetical protein MNV49_001727 [Pseudohyphozyma bogoriensis]|nr:hypothetical protein MNV49_001727 [Pseudohyphozyma bogoriensis]